MCYFHLPRILFCIAIGSSLRCIVPEYFFVSIPDLFDRLRNFSFISSISFSLAPFFKTNTIVVYLLPPVHIPWISVCVVNGGYINFPFARIEFVNDNKWKSLYSCFTVITFSFCKPKWVLEYLI